MPSNVAGSVPLLILRTSYEDDGSFEKSEEDSSITPWRTACLRARYHAPATAGAGTCLLTRLIKRSASAKYASASGLLLDAESRAPLELLPAFRLLCATRAPIVRLMLLSQ